MEKKKAKTFFLGKTRVTISLEKQVIKELDELKGHVPRSLFINLFLKKYLNGQTAEETLKSH